jgi:hypothetical protein
MRSPQGMMKQTQTLSQQYHADRLELARCCTAQEAPLRRPCALPIDVQAIIPHYAAFVCRQA